MSLSRFGALMGRQGGELGYFGDARRAAMGTTLIERVMETGSLVIRKLGCDRAGEVAIHRFLSAPSVTTAEMVETLAARTVAACAGRQIVVAQDTTEINFAGREERRRGLGPAGDGVSAGFFIHPLIAIDCETEAVLGLLGAKIWTRTDEIPAANAAARALEDKESIRWVEGAECAAARLAGAASVVVVADREGDIYSGFARCPAGVDLIVRAAQDRVLDDGTRLFAAPASWPELARTEVVVAPSRVGVPGRVAKVVVRAGSIVISRPRHGGDRSDPPHLTMHMVEAREIDGPAGVTPLLWRLLTTRPVTSAAEAQEIVRLYRLRWRIEEIFRALKSDGMRLEETQMNDAGRLFKLALVGMAAATRTMQLVNARDGGPRPATDVIDEALLPAAEAIGANLERKTRVSKTPIRATRSLGSPGSLPVSADGTATTNLPDPKPCAPDGPSSLPWQRASSSPFRRQMCESRRLRGPVGPQRPSGCRRVGALRTKQHPRPRRTAFRSAAAPAMTMS